MGGKPRKKPLTEYQRVALPVLKESIKHWDRLIDEVDGEEPYAENCACCQKFMVDDINCTICPIRLRTGLNQCWGTPWYDALCEYKYKSNYREGHMERMRDFLLGTLRMVERGEIAPEV